MTTRSILLSLAAPALLALPTLAADQVLVVDDDGGAGVDFTHLQDAIEAAGEGDLVLIRDGHYPGLTITPGA